MISHKASVVFMLRSLRRACVLLWSGPAWPTAECSGNLRSSVVCHLSRILGNCPRLRVDSSRSWLGNNKQNLPMYFHCGFISDVDAFTTMSNTKCLMIAFWGVRKDVLKLNLLLIKIIGSICYLKAKLGLTLSILCYQNGK